MKKSCVHRVPQGGWDRYYRRRRGVRRPGRRPRHGDVTVPQARYDALHAGDSMQIRYLPFFPLLARAADRSTGQAASATSRAGRRRSVAPAVSVVARRRVLRAVDRVARGHGRDRRRGARLDGARVPHRVPRAPPAPAATSRPPRASLPSRWSPRRRTRSSPEHGRASGRSSSESVRRLGDAVRGRPTAIRPERPSRLGRRGGRRRFRQRRGAHRRGDRADRVRPAIAPTRPDDPRQPHVPGPKPVPLPRADDGPGRAGHARRLGIGDTADCAGRVAADAGEAGPRANPPRGLRDVSAAILAALALALRFRHRRPSWRCRSVRAHDRERGRRRHAPGQSSRRLRDGGHRERRYRRPARSSRPHRSCATTPGSASGSASAAASPRATCARPPGLRYSGSPPRTSRPCRGPGSAVRPGR